MFDASYGNAFTLDVITSLVCFVLLLRYGRLKHSHPATPYFVFHLFTFTTRLFKLFSGAPTMFADDPFAVAVAESEITRAAFWGDVALVAMTAVWVSEAVNQRGSGRMTAPDPEASQPIDKRIVWGVTAIALPLGVAALLMFGFVPGATGFHRDAETLGAWGNSSWLMVAQSWPGLCLLALVYVYGFRFWLALPMVGYLLVISLQGFSRFRVVIPAVLLLQIWLDARNRRWPGPWLWTSLVVLALLFFPMKAMGTMVQSGASADEIFSYLGSEFTEFSEHDAADHVFLDQFASTLTLVDRADDLALGHPYYAMLVIAVPRQFWANKPSTMDYLDAISTRDRPMRAFGMICTYLGEGYANFGTLALILYPLLIAFGLSRVSRWSERAKPGTVRRFGYLLIAANLVQVYRDGLVSLYVFTFVNMIPLMVILGLHWLKAWLPRRVLLRQRSALLVAPTSR